MGPSQQRRVMSSQFMCMVRGKLCLLLTTILIITMIIHLGLLALLIDHQVAAQGVLQEKLSTVGTSKPEVVPDGTASQKTLYNIDVSSPKVPVDQLKSQIVQRQKRHQDIHGVRNSKRDDQSKAVGSNTRTRNLLDRKTHENIIPNSNLTSHMSHRVQKGHLSPIPHPQSLSGGSINQELVGNRSRPDTGTVGKRSSTALPQTMKPKQDSAARRAMIIKRNLEIIRRFKESARRGKPVPPPTPKSRVRGQQGPIILNAPASQRTPVILNAPSSKSLGHSSQRGGQGARRPQYHCYKCGNPTHITGPQLSRPGPANRPANRPTSPDHLPRTHAGQGKASVRPGRRVVRRGEGRVNTRLVPVQKAPTPLSHARVNTANTHVDRDGNKDMNKEVNKEVNKGVKHVNKNVNNVSNHVNNVNKHVNKHVNNHVNSHVNTHVNNHPHSIKHSPPSNPHVNQTQLKTQKSPARTGSKPKSVPSKKASAPPKLHSGESNSRVTPSLSKTLLPGMDTVKVIEFNMHGDWGHGNATEVMAQLLHEEHLLPHQKAKQKKNVPKAKQTKITSKGRKNVKK